MNHRLVSTLEFVYTHLYLLCMEERTELLVEVKKVILVSVDVVLKYLLSSSTLRIQQRTAGASYSSGVSWGCNRV